MLQAESKLQNDGDNRAGSKSTVRPVTSNEPPTASAGLAVQAVANVRLAPHRKGNQPQFAPRVATNLDHQSRIPVIVGEVTFRGMIPVDGIVGGQPGGSGGTLSVRQRGRAFFGSDPEMNGEINFIDMLRVNGHIAGTVYSKKGTLIVDTAAQIDADVDVSVAVIGGTVNGDIVAHERVELRPTAKIYGNIWTHSLEIRSGAIFEGVCQMINGKADGK